jgi:N utilization substance protein A
VGWRIDIKSEEEKRQEVEAEMARMERIVEELRSLEGVSATVIQKLIDSGLAGLAHVLEMTDEELCQIEGIGPKTAEKIRESATAAKAEWDRKDAEEAARLEAERAEAERLAAEQAEEERRLAEAQLAEEQAEAETDDGAESPAEAAAGEGEAVAVAGESRSDAPEHGGEPDGER